MNEDFGKRERDFPSFFKALEQYWEERVIWLTQGWRVRDSMHYNNDNGREDLMGSDETLILIHVNKMYLVYTTI